MYTLRLGSIHLYPMLAGERDIVYAYVYGYGILPEMERKIGVRVRRRRRLGITSISSWKSVIWRGIISCFWREGERERKRERDRESWTEEPELDKFSIRSLIGRLFHPTQRERIQRRRTCTRPSLSLSLFLCLRLSLSTAIARPIFSLISPGYQCIAALSIGSGFHFFAYLTFRPGLSSVR